jgi:bacillolysin
MRISTALTAIGCLTLASAAAAQTSQTYVYDVHGRVTAATQTQPAASRSWSSYSYDAADNRNTRNQVYQGTLGSADALATYEFMVPQQDLVSGDSRMRLAFQSDGNLAVWFGSTLLWHAGTYGGQASVLTMQSDGNLVLYGGAYVPVWTSGTGGHPGARLVMQSDGNLVIFDGATPIWSTGTGGH